MNKNWPTKNKDIDIAQQIIAEYGKGQENGPIGLFELVVDYSEKKMNFRLANWVVVLAEHFNALYGLELGDQVTRQVITCCLTQGHTLH